MTKVTIRNLITHEVNPRFLSSFLKSETVSLSQFLERRTVETNERLLTLKDLDKHPVAGRRATNMLNARNSKVKPEDGGGMGT
jgi:hypothetical protein